MSEPPPTPAVIMTIFDAAQLATESKSVLSLAKRAGIQQASLNRWLTGAQENLSGDALDKLTETLGFAICLDGAKCQSLTLSLAISKAIEDRVAAGQSVTAIANFYGVSRAMIRRVLAGRPIRDSRSIDAICRIERITMV